MQAPCSSAARAGQQTHSCTRWQTVLMEQSVQGFLNISELVLIQKLPIREETPKTGALDFVIHFHDSN